MLRQFIIVGLLLGAACGAAPGQAADEYEWMTPDELIATGADWLQNANWQDLFRAPTPAEWQSFWDEVQAGLNSTDLDDLAWLQPAVDAALEWLRMTPQAEPYTDWLQQRADYFDMAGAVTRGIPVPRAPPPAAPPPPAPGKKQTVLTTHPQVKPSAAPPTVVKRRLESIQSRQNWEKKLARRPVPVQARDLVPRLKTVFDAEGVPREVVWIAEVESTMNPQALSPAGAAGLFQFMPATATRFGLQLKPEDERLAPEKSARAAARYLKILHRQFKSWPLAFAAYNAGEGRVSRLLKQSEVKTFEAIEHNLSLETQMYIPKIAAVVKLREGKDILQLPGPVAWRGCYPVIYLLARN